MRKNCESCTTTEPVAVPQDVTACVKIPGLDPMSGRVMTERQASLRFLSKDEIVRLIERCEKALDKIEEKANDFFRPGSRVQVVGSSAVGTLLPVSAIPNHYLRANAEAANYRNPGSALGFINASSGSIGFLFRAEVKPL